MTDPWPAESPKIALTDPGPAVTQSCWKVLSGRKSRWPSEQVDGARATDPLWANDLFVTEPPENLVVPLQHQ